MGHRLFNRTWVSWIHALALAFVGATGVAARAVDPPTDPTAAPLDDLDPLLRKWQHTAAVRAGAGYRDNVALSHAAPQGSGFLRSAVEAGTIRAPLDGNQILLLISAEDTRYFRNVTPDHEDLITANAEWRHFFPSPWEAALSLEGIYIDQVIDVSITETNRTPLPLRGGLITARPGVRREFSKSVWVSLEVPVARQYFSGSLDDYSEIGPKFTIGSPYGHKSETTISYLFLNRQFDTDTARTADGQPIPGTRREVFQHEVLWAWNHHWDAARRWLTVTKISFRALRDGASGYFDFDRWGIVEQIRYRRPRWELRAEARFAAYRFDTQTVSPDSSEKRERRDLSALLRGEATLTKHLKLFVEYDYERAFSNLALDEYRVNTVSGGLAVEF